MSWYALCVRYVGVPVDAPHTHISVLLHLQFKKK